MGRSLGSACANGHDDVVSVLNDYGAPLDSSDSYGRTPLVHACRNGNLPMVRLLLKLGADVRWKTGVPPLAAACDFGDLEVVKALVESGADPNPAIDITPLSLAFYSFTKSLVSGYWHYTPAKTDETFARLLLLKSANPNVRCEEFKRKFPPRIKHTALSRAMLSRTLMYGAAITGNAELLSLLFEKGADANVESGKDYYDALLDSCLNGREEVVKVLLTNGKSVPYRDIAYYRRVVSEAVEQHRSRIVELVLTEGHGFRAQSRHWYSGSLQITTNRGYDDIAKLLMDTGVELPEQILTLPPSPSARSH
jgi:ankyrin repeat protein